MYGSFVTKSVGGSESMKRIVGVRFKRPGKIYFFDPGKLQIQKRDYVIVELSLIHI